MGMKKTVATRAPHPETSHPATEPAIKELMPIKVGPLLKRLKKLDDSPMPTPKPKLAPEVLWGEGSSRKKDKGVARPRSMRDFCQVKAWVLDKPYMALEIAGLPKLVEEKFVSVAQATRKKAKKDLIVELSVALEKAQPTITQYKESSDFKSGLEKMGRVSYEFEYKTALTRF
ncbi:hypothetical protein BHE74_00047266 [Ensete ventricosum]|nr:hypothetical protein BHE74_00047266 [Ensete ventricosum]